MQNSEEGSLTLETVARKNLAPTFKKLPADLIARSHTEPERWEDDRYWWQSRSIQIGRAAVAWVEKVKPFAVLEWKDYHEAPDLIEKAKQLLTKKGVQASCIMCDPDFANDLTGNPNDTYTDMPTVGDGFEYMGLKIFRNFSCSYNDGMYIFDNRDARAYFRGRGKYYWNCPPYLVQVTRGRYANPTHYGTWFCASR